MKNFIYTFILALAVFFTATAQQASKTLDFVQTKDGQKYYGKIKEINPKEGVSFQTYGEGNVLFFKHEEIEIIKMAEAVKDAEAETNEPWYLTSLGLAYLHPSFDKLDPKNAVLLGKDSLRDYGINRVGIYLTPTFIVKSKHHFGILFGYEQGKNVFAIPIGINVKLGKKLGDKNLIYLNLMLGSFTCYGKTRSTYDSQGNYVSGYSESLAAWSTPMHAGVGLGFMRSQTSYKLFADITQRFDSYQFETHVIQGRYEPVFKTLQVRAGIMF